MTGSTRGLGLAIAQGLAEAGAHVVLNGRSESSLTAVAADFQAQGFSSASLVMDVTDEASITAGAATLQADGPIDILVNNVGIHHRAPLAEMTARQWREVIDVNLTSAFLVSRSLVTGMIECGAGKIINTCSLMSEVGRPTTGNYAASKGGLKMLTRAMAVEWAQYNIQANGIGPGYFETELTRPLVEDEAFDAWLRARTPAGRWGQAHELVGSAVFLASPASDFVNGQIIYVDGGLLAAI
ncbi:MAG: SDR family oxidoreductase [Planctomycetota bacterium]